MGGKWPDVEKREIVPLMAQSIRGSFGDAMGKETLASNGKIASPRWPDVEIGGRP